MSPAPKNLQQKQGELLSGLVGVRLIVNDVLVVGEGPWYDVMGDGWSAEQKENGMSMAASRSGEPERPYNLRAAEHQRNHGLSASLWKCFMC